MTYEYLCTACAHAWEAEQSISEAPLKDCPKCGQAAAKRQVSGGAGFILKGGGWYADLYSSSSKGAAAGKADAEGSSAKADASTKPDTSKGTSDSSKKGDSGSGSGGSSGSKGSPPASSTPSGSKAAAASAG